MIHVRHAIAAIESGLCKTVLVTHGESGKSMIGKPIVGIGPSQLEGQFQAPYGTYGPTTMFTLPALRYIKKYDIDVEKIANDAAVQRECDRKSVVEGKRVSRRVDLGGGRHIQKTR